MILSELSSAGVSIWLDDLSRDRLEDGSLAKLIAQSCVVGVTTNPSIFASAIGKSALYAPDIKKFAALGQSVPQITTSLTTDDVRSACDLFTDIYRTSGGIDGRVSIEVDPDLAQNVEATVARGRELFKIVDRPNLMIKVPATIPGLTAITELTNLGISVNVTLIFSVERYAAVADAYLTGLEQRLARNEDVSQIHSVASLFVSRVDTEIDSKLASIEGGATLHGRAGLANAHLAYEVFENAFQSKRFHVLKERGANLQRPLWASTGVKDKTQDPTKYVVELVAPTVVNTMPEATLDIVRSTGVIRGDTVRNNYLKAREILSALTQIGINLPEIFLKLENEGLAKFEQSWSELLQSVASVAN
jgi:transaldolase